MISEETKVPLFTVHICSAEVYPEAPAASGTQHGLQESLTVGVLDLLDNKNHKWQILQLSVRQINPPDDELQPQTHDDLVSSDYCH